MEKFAQYSPFISTEDSVQRVRSDPYLTPTQKNDIIRVLYGGASNSQNSLQGVMSTKDVVKGAIGAGIGGWVAKSLGTAVGGAFGGLSDKTLNKVQNVGAFAGMLRGTGLWQ